MKIRFLLVAGSLALLVANPAFAQNRQAMQQVIDLNRQAMEAYAQLDVDAARQQLERALQICQSAQIGGSIRARTHLNLGVVYVGGMGDNAQGMAQFVAAIRTDASIQLDPLTSTPEIQTVFNLARQQSGPGPGGPGPGGPGPGGPGPGGPGPGGPGPGGPGPGGPGGPPPGSLIIHTPPHEQLQQTPVPIYLEIPPFVTVGSVFLFYKGLGMQDFERVPMRRLGPGWGAYIPCLAVFPRSVAYYVVVQDGAGAPIAFAGNPTAPIQVAVVTQRTGPPPSLPNQAPPETCSETEECPPNFPGCHNPAACGNHRCEGDEEATCPADCIGNEGGEGEGEGEGEDTGPSHTHFFATIGGGLGFGFARAGDAWDDDDNKEEIQSGAALSPGFLRLEAGLIFLDKFSASVNFRYQLVAYAGDSEADTFKAYHIEARFSYWFLQKEILWAYAFVGSGFGMIQPAIGIDGVNYYEDTGLNNISAGGGALLRFGKTVGVNIQLDFDWMFPSSYQNFDLSAGLQLTF